MKFLIVSFLFLFISGCSLFQKKIPLMPEFPHAVKTLTEPCPDLKTIEGNSIAITDLLKEVINNYTLYYQCSLKNEGWNEWYKEQKKIYEELLLKNKRY